MPTTIQDHDMAQAFCQKMKYKKISDELSHLGCATNRLSQIKIGPTMNNGDENLNMGFGSSRSQEGGANHQGNRGNATASHESLSFNERAHTLLDLPRGSFGRTSRLRGESYLSNRAPLQYNAEQSFATSQMDIRPSTIDAAARLPSLRYQYDHNLIQSAYNYPIQTSSSLPMLTGAVPRPMLNFHNVQVPQNNGRPLASNLRLNEARSRNDSLSMHANNNYLACFSTATSTGVLAAEMARRSIPFVTTTTTPLAAYQPSSYPGRRWIDESASTRMSSYALSDYSGSSTATSISNMGDNNRVFDTVDDSIALNTRRQVQEVRTHAGLPARNDFMSNIGNYDILPTLAAYRRLIDGAVNIGQNNQSLTLPAYQSSLYPGQSLMGEGAATRVNTLALSDYSGSSAATSISNTGATDPGFGAADGSVALNAGQQETLTRTRLPTSQDPRSNVRNKNRSEPASNIADGIAASSAKGQGQQEKPSRTLEVPSDSSFLDPVHIFIRARCIEVFAATEEDMTAPGRGARPSKVGRVGLRCYYCRDAPKDRVVRQAVCFPSKRETIFESVRNFQRTHLDSCPYIPPPVQAEYKRMAELGSIKKRPHKYLRAYYAEAASELGIIDARDGLMFGAPPNKTGIPSPNLQALLDAAENPSIAISYWTTHASASENKKAIGLKKFEHVASESTRRVILDSRRESSLLVYPEDFPVVPDFEFVLFHQVTPFVLPSITLRQEDMHIDHYSKPFGLCCKHCVRAGEGRNHFPVELNSLADASLIQRMLSHLMKCPHVPQELKLAFDELKQLASDYCVKAKRGSVKRFFEKIWVRMRNYYEVKSDLRQKEKISG